MNLTVKDVADQLNVSEKTIYRMIQNATIPCFRVGGQWRFDRREIKSWIEDAREFSHKPAVRESKAEDEEGISVTESLQRGGIYYQVPGSAKQTAIQACLELIRIKIPSLDVKKLFASIMEREGLCPTAVGNGIALPHPRHFKKFTELSYISLCYLENPIPFGALDNEEVDTLFFIFPKSERRFLRIQAKLLRLLKDDRVLSSIKKGGQKEICKVLSLKEAEIFRGRGQ